MKYLLNTCVLSDARKKHANPNLIQWLKNLDEAGLFISVLTIGEIQKCIAKLNDSNNKNNYMPGWSKTYSLDLPDAY